MKPQDFVVEHKADGCRSAYHVQPVSAEYCTDYDLENYPALPYHCQWLKENRLTLCADCVAFKKQIVDLGWADDLYVRRLPECSERERVVALEASGQMTIEGEIAKLTEPTPALKILMKEINHAT